MTRHWRGIYLLSLFYRSFSLDVHQRVAGAYELYLYWDGVNSAHVGQVSRLELEVLKKQAERVVAA